MVSSRFVRWIGSWAGSPPDIKAVFKGEVMTAHRFGLGSSWSCGPWISVLKVAIDVG